MAIDQIPIGRFSLITRLSQKALRLYDERGLLVPQEKDAFTRYRYYTGSQIARGVSIKTLCELGFPLTEIETLLSAKEKNDTTTIRALFLKRRTDIRSEVNRLQEIEAILENRDASLELIYMSLNEPVVKDIAPVRIVGKRGSGAYKETITRLMTGLCTQLFSEENVRNGLKIAGPFMTLYHDGEYKEKDADMECAVPITGRITLSDPSMECRTLPGGKCLTLIYKGPYTGLHEAWTRIGAYAEEREFLINGPHRELYLNDPCTVAENELLTELQIPIDPALHNPGT
ncbi:MAG: MerR family transcriptional regulator [Methanoregula sp.]